MTTPDTLPATDERAEDSAGPRPAADDHADSPWHGIPAELLDGTHSYDTDTAGGCG